MIIDLTKLMYGQIYKLPVEGKLVIPTDILKNTDIRSISPVKVSGFIYNNEEELDLEVVVSGVMVLPCARTLKDVERPFSIEINESIDENDDKYLKIIQNRLDIFPIIWQYILVDVPLRVLHPDAKEEPIYGNGWCLITEDDTKEVIDPRLAKLKEYEKE